jgi:hypothetical protein
MVKNVVFPGCSSLTALTYSSLADIQKFITLRPFIASSFNGQKVELKVAVTFLAV